MIKNKLDIDKDHLTSLIFDIVSAIPYGRATSYGAIAKAIGFPNMSRMVGRIMSQCDSYITNIPAHRVVNSQGRLSASSVFPDMQQKLIAENIIVVNNKIQNWKQVFWNPMDEITF